MAQCQFNSLSNFSRKAAGLLLCTAAMTVYAAEGVSPLQPGATTGNPAGALPPPGLYFAADVAYETGKIKNGEGKTAVLPNGQQIKAKNVSAVMALTWVPGWEVLGARYAMGIAQPYKWAETRFSGAGNTQTVKSNGPINTAFMPVILSWDLGNSFHVGSGVALYARNGKFDYNYDAAAGRNVKAATAVGNRYWTVEPNLAITYLKDGWNITLNNIIDFNTENKTTRYRSGNTYYLDATVSKRINNFTVGVIGNYTRQFTDDEIRGQKVAALSGVNSEGNRAEHILLGPMLGYDFGKFSVTARVLFNVRAKNDCGVSFFHVGVAIPFGAGKK